VQQFMAQQVTTLASVETKAEMVDRLNKAQDEAHKLSNAIEDVDAPPELYNVRAALALAMRTVTLDLGRIRGLVTTGDMADAKELLATLKSPQAVADAIAELQNSS
jgi:thioredoxin-like negative regulator of GroEL